MVVGAGNSPALHARVRVHEVYVVVCVYLKVTRGYKVSTEVMRSRSAFTGGG